jgi:hypothetical protein
LITTRLLAADFESLVSKITARTDSWLVKHLSFAGRLQLISSVLFSLQYIGLGFLSFPRKLFVCWNRSSIGSCGVARILRLRLR